MDKTRTAVLIAVTALLIILVIALSSLIPALFAPPTSQTVTLADCELDIGSLLNITSPSHNIKCNATSCTVYAKRGETVYLRASVQLSRDYIECMKRVLGGDAEPVTQVTVSKANQLKVSTQMLSKNVYSLAIEIPSNASTGRHEIELQVNIGFEKRSAGIGAATNTAVVYTIAIDVT